MKDLSTIKTSHLNGEQKEFVAQAILAGCKKPADIAKLLNMTRSMVTQVLQGKITPRPTTLELLRMKANDSGSGKYPVREENIVGLRDLDEATVIHRAREEMSRAIDRLKTAMPAPVISWARGGEGAYFEDQGMDVPRIYVPCKDPNCYVLQLVGDSMHPVYLEGDLLVVAPNTPPTHNDVVIVKTTEDEVMCKIMKHPRKAEAFEFHSYNPHYPPIFLRPDQIYRVSAVHSVIRPLKERIKAMAVEESGHMP